MKKLLFFILLIPSFVFAQNNLGKNDDLGRISISAYVPAQEGLTPETVKSLESKLSQLAVKNGLSGSVGSRFIITAKVNTLTKDITPTAPPMQSYTLEITLYIGDGFEGTLFSSTSFTTKGVGDTEAKAYQNALKAFNINNPKYQDFVNEGKEKIIQYYNTKCDFILKGAQALVAQKEFDAAIYTLDAVPEVCKDCFDKATDMISSVYQAKLNDECGKNLAAAEAAWAERNASLAADYLSAVTPDTKCYSDAVKLRNSIASKLDEIDKREWDLKVKQEYDLKSQGIEAARAVGVAYGQHQQPVSYKSLW